ncbi:metal ABC transporter permease [Helicobacter mustelae]|uniref:ABC transporter integral membrane protein n=1 Tax=Helicobacter mustelae (strain ATCC 43772 / CCUG 25715 / CIP 103759 / LMG 18044 / NCTC 12198 / R85-136P) TaxID=679897 RepID=D3UHK7_HELM1|nr:metal ABC transporter permease [Helicobacter mustelae]CBG39979.1 ABC transporter integral membrane protein [Helicobacter mustelae 12198]SQH71493.1 ABC transporter integral membrane protein [Helicobacter mustelae]STP12619.1 ABC transporter integral membrane protein [Helicobacter mustelae]
MLDFFRDYPFLYNAFLASFLISICAGIVGSIVVSSKSVFLTGGVAHGAFGGVGLALFFGFSATLGASIAAVLMALLISFIYFRYKNFLDSYVAALWAFGMAIGVICIDLSKGYGSDISSYLFGSIIAVSTQDLWRIGIFDGILILFVSVFYREILSIFYDTEFCQLKKIPTTFFQILIFIFVSLGVVMSMSAAGLILVISILSIPAYIAHVFASSLREQMFYSWIFSLCFMWGGFYLSYKMDLSIGACVVVVSVVSMAALLLGNRICRRFLVCKK